MAEAGRRRTLLALVAGQVCLHATLAGLRLAAPLLALARGRGAVEVGVLMAVFAVAQVAVALGAGRMADRSGYHRPIRLAVNASVAGGVLAVFAAWADALPGLQFGLLCAAAALAGAGANIGLITIQRTAGRHAADRVELKKVFSWLGLAPALANVVGPLLAGALIDTLGYAAACAALAALPLAARTFARRVPVETPPAEASRPGRPGLARSAWQLLATPGLKRLLLVNWLLSASWDVHSFALPILGHERGFSASQVGLVLGAFSAAVAGVRVVIPWVAHALSEARVLVAAMLVAGLVLGIYPFVTGVLTMMACAVGLGMALGAVQPMIMTLLHQLTPPDRHGEAIALRSMTINVAGSITPMVFGVLGGAFGAAALFWTMGGAVGAGSWAAGGLRQRPSESGAPPDA